MRYLSSVIILVFSGLALQADGYVPPQEKTGHWAWKAPVRPVAPTASDWVKNPIDSFVLTRLEKAGLQPAKLAAREQLIRRVTLDLIGLPPTPVEIDAFV